jgi:O-antigen ligase
MTPSERIPATTYSGLLGGVSDLTYERAIYWTALGSTVSILLSIAASQILLGLGLILIVLRRRPVTLPPIMLPLALFVLWTVVSVVFSADPRAGLPQIRKFFVFGTIPLVSAAFLDVRQLRTLVVGWSIAATMSAVAGFAQVIQRHREALRVLANHYEYYLDDRIRGFAGHWMTFGAEQMIVLVVLVSFLMFVNPPKWRVAGWICAAALWVAIMLGLTRSIFLLGAPAGLLVLLWSYKTWMVAIIPVVALVSYFAVPFQVRDRIESVIAPHEVMDSNSNSHRQVTRRTGWAMIKAHPLLGLGPEEVGAQFDKFVPNDIRRPLPRGWYGHLHNIYLQYAAERGIPALLFLLWMIGKMIFDFTRAFKLKGLPREVNAILHGAVAVIVAILAEGFFEHNLGDSEVLTLFLAVTSVVYAAIRMVPEGRRANAEA